MYYLCAQISTQKCRQSRDIPSKSIRGRTTSPFLCLSPSWSFIQLPHAHLCFQCLLQKLQTKLSEQIRLTLQKRARIALFVLFLEERTSVQKNVVTSMGQQVTFQINEHRNEAQERNIISIMDQLQEEKPCGFSSW